MRRTWGTLVASALLCSSVAAAPATAATGPALLDAHDLAYGQRVTALSSSAAGTVYLTRDYRVLLVPAPATSATEPVEVAAGIVVAPAYANHVPTISGARVAVPVPAAPGQAALAEVRTCLVGACPVMTSYAVPEGYRYLGNAGDAAILHAAATNTIALAPWDGGEPQLVPLGDLPAPATATGDANGVAFGRTYLARPAGTLTTFGGPVTLSPSYAVWSEGSGTSWTVRRVPRATPGAEPEILAGLGSAPAALAATDAGFAYRLGSGVFSHAYGGPQAALQVAGPSTAPAPFEGGPSLVVAAVEAGRHHALYAFAPGSGTAAVAHRPPPVPATTWDLTVDHGRAAYVDDSGASGEASFLRPVPGGVPGVEAPVVPGALGIGLSGPYVATTHFAVGGSVGLSYGRVDGQPTYVELLGGAGARPVVSGHRVLVTGAVSTVVDMLTGQRTYLGDVLATLWGDVVVTVDGRGRILRRNLVTGAVQEVRPAGGCPGTLGCVQKDGSRVAAWGGDVVYALSLGGSGRVTGFWSGGTTKPLPMLDAGWNDVSYWDGLLVSDRAGAGVRLDDLRTGESAVVDAAGTLASGRATDGLVLGWNASAFGGRAAVQPVTDFLPSYAPENRHLTSVVPRAFGPGLAPSTWRPRFYVSQAASWQVAIRRGSATGPLVRTLSGASDLGEITPVWDGKDGNGAPAPHGTYAWTLTSGAGTRSGSVFLSRVAPATPRIAAPELVSDVSADGRYRVSWAGAAAGNVYRLERSVDGMTYQVIARTAKTSLAWDSVPGRTYRYRLRVQDPAGRLSAAVAATVVSPYDDRSGYALKPTAFARAYDSRHWQGSQLRTTRAWDQFTVSVRGTSVWLVGVTGPGYGRFEVTVDDPSRVWTVDAYSATTRYRQVLFRLGGLADARHSISVMALPTPGRTGIGVDGVGARRAMEQ